MAVAKEAEEAAAAKIDEYDPENERIPQTPKKGWTTIILAKLMNQTRTNVLIWCLFIQAIGIGESLGELPAAIKDLAVRWTFIFICLEGFYLIK